VFPSGRHRGARPPALPPGTDWQAADVTDPEAATEAAPTPTTSPKGEHVLRFEATVRNTRELRCRRGLDNFPETSASQPSRQQRADRGAI
jgi:hypothetical protein